MANEDQFDDKGVAPPNRPGGSILPAHIRPPRRRQGYLPRAELVAKVVNAARAKRLVLLSAASGFGKTVLLSDVYRELAKDGLPVLWLSLTETHRDPAWISRTLVDQLVRHFDTQPSIGEDFGMVANRLVGDEPAIIIIDNWNFIESEPANQLFERMLIETDGLVNFVVGSRTTPGFLFETLCLTDDFAGFTSRDLAFSTEEAISVLQQDGPATPSLVQLIDRTEGWPAGVQLLRLALQQAGASNTSLFEFSGSRADVANYLGKTVFRYLEAEHRAFLCNIAVLDELSSELVAAVLDAPGAASTFMAAERRNFFLSEVSEGSGRYRFHSMFRDFLLSQHDRDSTVAEALILQRAERWHSGRGEHDQAIEYALRLGESERAMALLEDYAGDQLQEEGKVFLFTSWVEKAQRAGSELTPIVERFYSWSLVFSGRWHDAREFVASREDVPDTEISAIIASFSDNQRMLRSALEVWHAQGAQRGSTTHAVMECAEAISAMAQGHIDAAVDAGHRARFANERASSVFGRVWTLIISGFALLLKGNAGDAEPYLRDAIRSGERLLGTRAPVTRVARLMAAIISWYRCADEQARKDLDAADLAPDEHGLPIIVVGAASVSRALNREWTSRHVEGGVISPGIALVRSAYKLEALLQRGDDMDKARDMARTFTLQLERARADNPRLLSEAWMLRDIHTGIQARLMLANNDPDGAIHLLNPAIIDCQRRGRGLAEQHLTLLKVGALLRTGARSPALRLLIQASEQAVRGGSIRPFEGERRFIAPLLPALAAAGERAPIGDPERWRLFRQTLQLPLGADGDRESDEREEVEAVTDREGEILAFLEMGLSNQEIAARLAIRVPTVKWHLHNLFTKLRVRNRSSAVRYARENNLIATPAPNI